MESSELSSGPTSASDVASSFSACRDEVLDDWRKRVVVEVEASTALGNPILIDTLPILYANISEALSAGDSRDVGTSGTNLAHVHGRERANMTEYGPQDLIRELQIFREVLFEVANRRGLHLSKHDADVIGHSIEEATRESIVGYNAANKEVNEAFIASLSHDLRNPLHVASASAQFIQLTTSDPKASALAKRVVEKIREADAMIQTLLDAAVLKARMRLKLHLTQFDILALVNEVCVEVPLDGQPVQVAGETLTGYWCRVSMKRVLENLTSNAQKYGDTSQPITVGVQRVDDRMLLSVHNEGAPIPVPDIPRLFNTFERIEDVDVKGWGLGLPFVQNVVESHGGSVIVDSAEGRGTTFTVSVPIDARPYVTH
jgi:signal transduction histidine kinase